MAAGAVSCRCWLAPRLWRAEGGLLVRPRGSSGRSAVRDPPSVIRRPWTAVSGVPLRAGGCGEPWGAGPVPPLPPLPRGRARSSAESSSPAEISPRPPLVPAALLHSRAGATEGAREERHRLAPVVSAGWRLQVRGTSCSLQVTGLFWSPGGGCWTDAKEGCTGC